jgi:hypothetical protein
MRRPSAVLHMVLYGLIHGFLLSTLYVYIVDTLVMGGGSVNLLGLIQTVYLFAFLSFFIGAVPGTILGFISGCILWYITRYIEPPIDTDNIQKSRNRAYAIIGSLTLLGISCLVIPIMLFLLKDSVESEKFLILWFGLPLPIASFAAIYAVHRYFLKLQAWGSVGKVKNKAKHVPTNQLAYTDTAEAENYRMDEGVNPQQQKNG